MIYRFATNIRNFLTRAIQGPPLMQTTPGCVKRRNSRHLALLALAAGAVFALTTATAFADNPGRKSFEQNNSNSDPAVSAGSISRIWAHVW
jgi:hypothetical protein